MNCGVMRMSEWAGSVVETWDSRMINNCATARYVTIKVSVPADARLLSCFNEDASGDVTRREMCNILLAVVCTQLCRLHNSHLTHVGISKFSFNKRVK